MASTGGSGVSQHPGQGGGQQRRGVFDVDEDRALEVLRLSWGDVYDIGREDGRWIAGRRDGRGVRLTGETPDAVNIKMRADWARRGAS